MAAQPSASSAPSSSAAAMAGPAGAEGGDTTPGSSKASGGSSATTALPVRDKESFQKLQIERFVTRDWIHTAGLNAAEAAMRKDAAEMRTKTDEFRRIRTDYRQWFTPSKLYGEGYKGFGNGFTDRPPPSVVVYPNTKPRPGKRQTPPLRWKRKDMLKQAEYHEELVPVRLDVEWDGIKLRDTFTWNLHERLVRPDLFAAQLVEDMAIKPPAAAHVYEQILQQLMEQLIDFFPFAYSEEDALDPELPYSAYKNDEMRILIKLNITIGTHTLIDQFEWELNNPSNSPEEFAAGMARDLSLSGEFTTAIAHCIREQCQLFTRSLYSVGHPFDGRPIEDPDLVSAFLPSPLPNVFRPQQQAREYAPYLYEMSEADLERNEMTFSREQRRQKRSVNRRGGPQLPDLKERARTIRTLIVSSVLPGAATDVEDSRLYKKVVGIPGTRKRAGRDDDISDSESSEDSSPDSPALSNLPAGGTARTRGLRGAASAAQQRMANLGRSETPDASTVHAHETRISSRRGRDTREETEEPNQLIVTLKVNKEKLKKILRDSREVRVKAGTGTPTPGPPTPSVPPPASSASSRGPSQSQTPIPQPVLPPPPASSTMGPPPPTPSAVTPKPTPKPSTPASSTSTPTAQIGRLPAPPPVDGQPPPQPPPPEWLKDALLELNKHYPDDSFEGLMKYAAVNTKTDTPVQVPPGAPIPEDVQYMHLPRIRCLDCPGKLYTPGPEKTVGNFEVHLKNRQHREKVNLRLKKQGVKPSPLPPTTGAGSASTSAS